MNEKPTKRGNPVLVKGGPALPGAGRPKGSKNAMTLLRQAVIEKSENIVLENWEKIVRKTIELAEAGETTALKILWDRMSPAVKAVDNTKKDALKGITIIVQGAETTRPGVTIDGEYTSNNDYEEQS